MISEVQSGKEGDNNSKSTGMENFKDKRKDLMSKCSSLLGSKFNYYHKNTIVIEESLMARLIKD